MAFLLHCSSRFPQPVVLGFSSSGDRTTALALRIHSGAPSTPPTSRFNNAVRLQARQSSFVVFASNTDPSDKDFLEKKTPSDGAQTGDAGQNPPFLTILAGLLVFFLVLWIIGSVVTWLISLVVHFPSSK